MNKNILLELRKKNNMTQEEVAKKIKTSFQSYNRMENKDIKSISTEYLQKLADLYKVTIDYLLSYGENKLTKTIKIPVLGTIPAGIPLEAIEDIVDYEEISTEMAKTGDFFGLKVKGNSMSPRILNNDIVIIRKQENAENGDICAILVNGFEVTLKQIYKDKNGIKLIPFNKEYSDMYYTNEQITTLPIKIIGKVVELRGKF